MREIGLVTKINDNKATVKVDKKDECSKCGMCLFPKNASSVEFEVENRLGAKLGDTVLFETQKDAKLLGAVLVFLVPLLLIGVSAVLAFLVIKKEIYTLIFSLIFIVAWFFVLALIDKKLKKTQTFCPSIISVYKSENIEK